MGAGRCLRLPGDTLFTTSPCKKGNESVCLFLPAREMFLSQSFLCNKCLECHY